MTLFEVVLKTRAGLHADADLADYVSGYDGLILAAGDDDRPRAVGRVVARKVHAWRALNDGVPLFDVCDCDSDELHRLHVLLYGVREHHFRPRLQDRYDAWDYDLLVVDHVVIAPRWRSLRLGLLAVRRVVDLLGGGCGLVAAEVLTLRREAHRELRVPAAWLPANRAAAERAKAAVKIRRHFRRMGFWRVGRTAVYVLPVAQVTPSAAELVRGPAAGQ